MAKSSFLEILGGYEQPDGSESQGKRFAAKHITGSVGRNVNQSRMMRRFSALCTRIADLLAYTASRAYGMFLLGFGLLTLLLHFAKDYLNINLKLFQKILLYMMMCCNFFMYLAARGQGL